MSEKKKILVPGGTGAMGVYLVPELLALGYAVDVVSLDDVKSDDPDLRYFKADFKNPEIRAGFLKNGYDAIVDFMIYKTDEFKAVYRELLSATDHYIYLSTYRIYADEEHPIKETSPRLLDVSTDEAFLATEDYALYKARGENILRESEFDNWTGIRPAITYSKTRFQLVTLEANIIIHRAKLGKTVLLPEEAMNVRATMSWAGDVAKMISRLLFNDAAKRELYSVCTAEHHTWGEIAEYYRELVGLKYVTVPKEEFLKIFHESWRDAGRYQLIYDRLFDRVMDNSKILSIAGMKQSELMPLYDGLKLELSRLPADTFVAKTTATNDTMDAILAGMGVK